MSLHTLLVPPPQTAFLPLGRSFFERDSVELARDLLGRFLVHKSRGKPTIGRIVETEAYTGAEDKAAHVFGGKRTDRTEVFWKPGGHAYVYRIYGKHDCFNVVAGKADEPRAVLVRALEPVEGIDKMAKRRGISLEATDLSKRLKDMANLMNGPGKLCQAMGIDTAKHYGVDLTKGALTIQQGTPPAPDDIQTGPRVNVDYAEEYAALPYRFWVKSSPCVSKG